MIEDTLESLQEQLKKSSRKLEELRNLIEEAESKVLIELSWQRYLKHKIITKERIN